MSSNSPHHGLVAMLLVGLFSGIGFWIAMEETNELGTVRHWFWIGIGVAVLYLLTVIANSLDRLEDER